MKNSDTTIIYITDNSLNNEIFQLCRDHLAKEAKDYNIISISQSPMSLGDNICVGNIGRSWLSLYKQLLTGIGCAKTKYIAIAEHDCLYTPQHFQFIPPSNDIFYYNNNCWIVQWQSTKPELDYMYSYWPKRYNLSQLICNRELLYESVYKTLNLIDKDTSSVKIINKLATFGKTHIKLEKLRRYAKSGKSVYLKGLINEFSDHIGNEKCELFKTKLPNLDIRHQSNFTGPKRGKNRRYTLPYWGNFKDFINERLYQTS